jgi:hypothetical protein
MSNLIVFQGFGTVALEVALALMPLVVIFLLFQLIYKLPWDGVSQILIGVVISFVGLAFFLQGVNVGFIPAGASLGEQISKLDHNWVIIPVGFLLGLVTALAEPSVKVLTIEVEAVSGGYINQKTLLVALSIGVAISVGLAMLKIVFGVPLMYILLPGYVIVFIMLKFTSDTFIPVAFDSGAVATGPMTVTFIMAMAIGVATGIEGRDPLLDGFGLVALVFLAPILSVLTMGLMMGGEKARGEGR